MTRRIILTSLLYLLIFIPLYSQLDKDSIKNERFKKIEYYHYSIGVDGAMHHNYSLSPKLFLGIGSARNLLNADIGIKYYIQNPYFQNKRDYISSHELIMFASLDINVIRGKEKSFFLGGEVASHFRIRTTYTDKMSDIKQIDSTLGNDYFSAKIKMGLRINRWEAQLFYEYDLSPSINQKYVYESKVYDYNYVYNSIFERGRLGVGVTYYFPFKL